jgi:hypothetical protein
MKNEEFVFGKNKEGIPREYIQVTNYRDKTIDKIDDPNRKFINGFKAIKIGEETYGYVRESDNKLMPYHYDNAHDFNEYGFAIVGREGAMTWINKDFRYLRNDQRSGYYDNHYAMSEDYLYDPYRILHGFHSVGEFSDGDIPLSRIGVCWDDGVIYFGTDGKVKKFYKYGDEKEKPLCKFYKGTAFNEDGIAIAEHNKEKLILFAEGYCIAFDDITKLALDRGFIESINNEVKEKCLKKTLK